jgi:hypothetical protein
VSSALVRRLVAATGVALGLSGAAAVAQDANRVEPKPKEAAPSPDDEYFRERDEAAAQRTRAREPGLAWLARHQSEDGRWSARGFAEVCTPRGCCDGHGKEEGTPELDNAVSAAALLAFLASNITPRNKSTSVDPVTSRAVSYGKTVERGLAWLLARQREDGRIAPEAGPVLLDQALATLALTEAFGLTNSRTYGEPAERAVRFIERARTEGLGWGARPGAAEDDTRVTTWCVMALQSARIGGISVDDAAFEGAHAWLDKVTHQDGVVQFDGHGALDRRPPGPNEGWATHPDMTARALLCRMFQKKRTPLAAKEAKLVARDLPRYSVTGVRRPVDFEYWYFGDLALLQWEGFEGEDWRAFDRAVRKALVSSQRTLEDGCLAGSWDAGSVDRYGHEGGRVYATALNVLVLSCWDRFPCVFRRTR